MHSISLYVLVVAALVAVAMLAVVDAAPQPRHAGEDAPADRQALDDVAEWMK